MKIQHFIIFELTLSLFFSIKSKYIIYEKENNKAILNLNYLSYANIFDIEIFEELDKIIDNIDINIIHSLIIIIHGNYFQNDERICIIDNLTKKEYEYNSRKGNKVLRKIEKLSIPVICIADSQTLGPIFNLIMCCDIRIASEKTFFGFPEVGLGFMPLYGGMQRLTRLVGIGIAKQMVYTSQIINANEAIRIGLINNIYPKNDLLNEVNNLISVINKNSKSTKNLFAFHL